MLGTRLSRSLVTLTLCGLTACFVSSCATHANTKAAPFDLPAIAAPNPALADLGFLTGRWLAVNPNGTVNEEVWTPPRGKVCVGTFRQVRRDGDCAFVEVSQIALDGDDVVLRLRHMHRRLEVPAKRKDVNVFRLVSLSANRVEFAGTEKVAGVRSVVYERTGPHELVQSIGFDPKTGEKSFVTKYRLDDS